MRVLPVPPECVNIWHTLHNYCTLCDSLYCTEQKDVTLPSMNDYVKKEVILPPPSCTSLPPRILAIGDVLNYAIITNQILTAG